jgi:hypothetical protein
VSKVLSGYPPEFDIGRMWQWRKLIARTLMPLPRAESD